MKEDTFTFTARSNENPEKTATFTLFQDSVSVQLGTAILEQLDSASDSYEASDEDGLEGIKVIDWAKPVATGTLQKILQPLSIHDFDADLDDKSFRMTAWVRSKGLRLAPIIITWEDVDNPVAAQAFVNELRKRKKASVTSNKLPSVFDYWASWIIAGISSLVVFVAMLRLFKQFLTDDIDVETT